MKQSFTGGRFNLVLDGSDNLGFVKSIKGGNIKGEVATHSLGAENIQKKHLATIIHEPITIEVGMGMSKGFYEWIDATFDKGYVTKSGEFIARDFDYKAMSTREFIDAHIAEVTIPSLDGSSKDPAYITVKLDPERIRYKSGDGNVVKAKAATGAKKWLSSNFKLELGSLPCARVSKIDSFTWKQGIITDEVGAFRKAALHLAKVEVPNLKLTISMADISAWQDWHKSFVIDGKNNEGAELTGAITLMAPDMVGELAKISLKHVGIISLESAAQVAQFTVELYIEKTGFQFGRE